MVTNLLWTVIVTLIKLSVLSLYIVIFSASVKFRRVCYAIAAVQIVFAISFFIGILTQCQPLAYTWDRSIPGGSCVSDSVGFYLTSVQNLVMDVVVLLLPVRMVWRLQMDTRRKIAVTVIFGLGFL